MNLIEKLKKLQQSLEEAIHDEDWDYVMEINLDLELLIRDSELESSFGMSEEF